MDENKREINTSGSDITCFITTAIATPEKVYNTVNTFLNKGLNNFKAVRVETTKTKPEKVDATVTTF
ncbi:hypothetical protein [Emticicia fontis]